MSISLNKKKQEPELSEVEREYRESESRIRKMFLGTIFIIIASMLSYVN